jgi:hypothetical protein
VLSACTAKKASCPISTHAANIAAQFGVTFGRITFENEPLGKIDMKILKVAVALGLATSLSGCLTTDDAVDVDVIAAANSLLERTNFAYSVDITDLTSKATMTGFITGRMMEMPGGGGLKVEEITFQESTSQAFAGQMSLEADFDSGAVTGSTSNLGLYEYSDNCMKRSFTFHKRD